MTMAIKKFLSFISKTPVSYIMAAATLFIFPICAEAAPIDTDYGCHFSEGSGSCNITVTATKARQGEQCMAAIESVLDGYTLADTYNITFTNFYQVSYQVLDEPADLVFQIPEIYQSPSYIFRMIHIYRGKATVLEDMDASVETITFRHDRAGAYALVYRDVPSSMPADGENFDSLMFVTPAASDMEMFPEKQIVTDYLPTEQIISSPVGSHEITLHNYYSAKSNTLP